MVLMFEANCVFGAIDIAVVSDYATTGILYVFFLFGQYNRYFCCFSFCFVLHILQR